MSVDTNAKPEAGYGWGETIKIVLQALAIALVVRIFFYQPFNIPSGSMKDTLLVGDFLFVSKLSYGYSKYTFPRAEWLCVPGTEICGLPNVMSSGRVFASEPKRGDVIVFKLPRDNSTDYIKRLIGLPGDLIQMKQGVLYINGTAVERRKVEPALVTCYDHQTRPLPVDRYVETLPNGVKYHTLDCNSDADYDTTDEYVVPEGHYFMMGDNRDNSVDSRVPTERGVGFVPAENLIGRADIIFYSCASDEAGRCSLFTPWTWLFDIRWSRIFNLVR